MSVNGTTEPIEITVENKNPVPTENSTMSIEDDGRTQSSYHTIEIKNTSFLLNIAVDSDSRPKLYVVFGPKSNRPTLKRHTNKTELPNNSSCTWVDPDRHQDGDEPIDLLTLEDWDEVQCTQNPYSFFLSDNEQLYGNYTYGKKSEYFADINVFCTFYCKFLLVSILKVSIPRNRLNCNF